jgi:dephospho-CoA kinase
MARDNISEEYALARIHAQPTPEEFSARCDYTLKNDGSEQAFQEKCLAFLKELAIINP